MPSFLRLSRQQGAWALYDFANSAFATSFLAVIFNVYFTQVLVPEEGALIFGFLVPGPSLWSYLISSVMLCVVFLAPLLGSLADQKAIKQPLWMAWTTVGALATMGLVTAVPGTLAQTTALVFIAVLGFEMSLVFYNAFLKDIASEAASGSVSGLGFALGYLGGGLCLALNLVMLNKPALFGINAADPTAAVRVGMLVVGIWWLVFALPSFLVLRDQPRLAAQQPVVHPIATLKWIRSQPVLGRFLLSYLIYEDGIQTVLLLASIFGAKELGMSTSSLALCYLMIQFVAVIGAVVCGRLADTWGHKKVVMTTLVLFSVTTAWAVFMRRPGEFWALGVVVGLVMGGSQAASRSLFSLMIPKDRSAELFGLFSIVGKAAAFLGPFVFGVVSQIWGLRAGVGSLLIFFVVGAVLLSSVHRIDKND